MINEEIKKKSDARYDNKISLWVGHRDHRGDNLVIACAGALGKLLWKLPQSLLHNIWLPINPKVKGSFRIHYSLGYLVIIRHGSSYFSRDLKILFQDNMHFVILSSYSTRNHVRIGYETGNKRHGMYMANVKPMQKCPTWSIFHLLALGLPSFALGSPGFVLGPPGCLDTNMLVSATQDARVLGHINVRPQHKWICVAVEYRRYFDYATFCYLKKEVDRCIRTT